MKKLLQKMGMNNKKTLDITSNVLIFVLFTIGGVLIGWHFIQEPMILHFNFVEINHDEFEENYNRLTNQLNRETEINEDGELVLVTDPESETDDETDETGETGVYTPEIVFDWDAVTMLDGFDWAQRVAAGPTASPVGEIIMPTIDVTLPIFLGIGEPNISIGAGTMAPGQVMGQGNYVLASHWHQYSTVLFGGLHRIQPGDQIFLRNADYLFVYETVIGNNHIIEASRIDILDYVPGKTYLTLFTCTPDGSQRVKVRAELVEVVPMSDINEVNERLAEMEELLQRAEEEAAAQEAQRTAAEQARLEEARLQAEEALRQAEEDARLLAEIAQILEEMDRERPPFPVVGVLFTTVGSLCVGAAAVWITSKGFNFDFIKRKK